MSARTGQYSADLNTYLHKVSSAPELLPHLKFTSDAVEEARKTKLEFTSIYNGHFLDYFGRPHIKTYQGPLTFVLDIANKTAAIPGTGNEPIVFTYSFDVAKFVAAALDLPDWPEELFAVGDRTTWNEFLKLAEEARGAWSLFSPPRGRVICSHMPSCRIQVQRPLRGSREAEEA